MKNVIITGANSGLGFETVKKIAGDKDCRVILACRSKEKAENAKAQIIAETNNPNIETMELDTSLLSSVRVFARDYCYRFGPVDVLINNAGISPMHGGTTAEGFELVFATNYLGHFLLTELLLPHMAENARILSITSDMHNPPGGIEWKGVEHLAHPIENDRRKYSYSKLCLIYYTHKLDERLRLEGSKITVNTFNPGFMSATNFSGGHADKARSLVVKTTMPERYGELESSSTALARLATEAEFSGISGQYFDRSVNTKRSSELSYNKDHENELWEKSREYCNLTEESER